jgi:hypothetical protein
VSLSSARQADNGTTRCLECVGLRLSWRMQEQEIHNYTIRKQCRANGNGATQCKEPTGNLSYICRSEPKGCKNNWNDNKGETGRDASTRGSTFKKRHLIQHSRRNEERII